VSQHITVLHKDRTVCRWHSLCCSLFQFSWRALMLQRIFADTKGRSLSSALRRWCCTILLRTSLQRVICLPQPLAKCGWLYKIASGSLLTAAFGTRSSSVCRVALSPCVASFWWLTVTSKLVLAVDQISKLHHTSVKWLTLSYEKAVIKTISRIC